MTEHEYFERRLEDQISWFERKSGLNKRRYQTFKIAEVAMAVAIPFMAGFTDDCEAEPTRAFIFSVAVGAMGVLIALLEGVQNLYKYQDNWIKYRTAAETLNREKFLFKTKSGHYRENQEEASSTNMLVERVEGILAEENTNWVSRVRQADPGMGDQEEEEGDDAGAEEAAEE